MARTPSNMIPLGTKAPGFSLPEPLTGKMRTLNELKSDKATVIIFMCNHCPFVIHIIDVLAKVCDSYLEKGIRFVAISSNDVDNYPDDSPEKMADFTKKHQFNVPYLYDESQEVAKAYQAACTPDLYVFDGDLSLIYRGQFDDSRPGNAIPPSGDSLTCVLDAVLNKKPIPSVQKPSIGCNIKWLATALS